MRWPSDAASMTRFIRIADGFMPNKAEERDRTPSANTGSRPFNKSATEAELGLQR